MEGIRPCTKWGYIYILCIILYFMYNFTGTIKRRPFKNTLCIFSIQKETLMPMHVKRKRLLYSL